MRMCGGKNILTVTILPVFCITVENVEKYHTYKHLTGLYEEIEAVRRDMEESAATGRAMKLTKAWKMLTKSYHFDVKVNMNSMCSVDDI